jgi:hypothetical protein
MALLTLPGCQRRGPSSTGPEPVPADLVGQTPLPHQRATAAIKLESDQEGIRVTLPWTGGELWRGHSALEFFGREVRVPLATGGSIVDSPVPDGRTLHYLARREDGTLAAASIETPPVNLPTVHHPRLVVDKAHYTLSVLDSDTVVKRYRIALGGDPVKSKICQDNLTTPEGVYTVYNLQPEASFHRAYDIDYPNVVDQIRHRIGQEVGLVPSDRDTGGEIQIHGCGSAGNWTAGCIALDDADIDELFQHSELAAGLEVFICGSEIKLEDRPWLLHPPSEKVRLLQAALQKSGHYSGAVDGQLGPGTQESLGRYQAAKGLPLTCQLDSATREHFKL